jgi:hypothetical protein
MTGPVNVDNFVFNFQAEHIFADSLFGNDAVGDFLRSRGYQKNALGNLMAEFTDADTVRKIQGDEALKEVLLDPNSRAGIVQHNSNASGGSQAGKNAFLRREIQGIIDSGASDPAKSWNIGGIGGKQRCIDDSGGERRAEGPTVRSHRC